MHIGVIRDQSIDERQHLNVIVIYNHAAAASLLSASMQLLHTHTYRGGQCVSLTLSVSDLLTFLISRMFKPKSQNLTRILGFSPHINSPAIQFSQQQRRCMWRRLVVNDGVH